MAGGDVGSDLTIVAVEVAERAVSLLDDLDAKRTVGIDMPPESVPVIDVELSANAGGNVCLITGNCTLGVDTFTIHVRE